jgi:hypothetical protein
MRLAARRSKPMWPTLRQAPARALSYVCPESWALRLVNRQARRLREELESEPTDKLLELLLFGMELAFLLLPSYRRNIENFRATYVFGTRDGRVAATARFAGGYLQVKDRAEQPATTSVTFVNPGALQRFLFSKDQDVLNSLLANEVEVDGNMSYLYKFGFMARDLTQRLGIS